MPDALVTIGMVLVVVLLIVLIFWSVDHDSEERNRRNFL